MAVIRPEHDKDLLGPLSAGRTDVLAALRRLDDSWEVLVQPRIGLDRPDFVGMHRDAGIVVIDVVDEGDAVGRRLFRSARTASVVVEQCLAEPGHDDLIFSAVRSIVVMPGHDSASASTILCDGRLSPAETDVEIWGGDALDDVVARLARRTVPYLPDSSYERAHAMIAPSECVLAPWARRRSGPVNREIALNPRRERIRRVRSSAGAGGTSAIAARAAHLAGEGRSVLVLSVNPALVRKLRSLVNQRCRQSAANPTLVTCASMHGFCRRVAEDATVDGMRLHLPPGVPLVDMNIARARAAYERGTGPRYDAILVDDGESLDPAWWVMLRDHVRHPGGEMLLVSTPTRCTPARLGDWHLVGDDDGTPWTELVGGGRLPHDMVPVVRAFAQEHLDLPADAVCVPDPLGVADGRTAPTVRRWVDHRSGEQLGSAVGLEVAAILDSDPTLQPNDVAFLCSDHQDGLDAVRVLEDLGYPVQHLFALDPAEQRRRSLRLWPGAHGITGATVEAFTGFDARAIVLGITQGDDSHRQLFVGLTRVHSPGDGRPAYLTVVNDDPELDPQMFAYASRPAPWSPPAIPPAILGA